MSLLEDEELRLSSPISSYDTPSSPALSASDSILNITPCTSPGPDDEFGIYSDSDVASQNSLKMVKSMNSSTSEFDSSILKPPQPIGLFLKSGGQSPSSNTSRVNNTPGRSRTLRRDSSESTPSPMPKKRLRRKSNKSDISEKSGRSSIRHSPIGSGVGSVDGHPLGTGYTLMPATGKIFRNLLILEESLREQVIQQRAIRRKYLTFLAVLCFIIASISHHLYFLEYPRSNNGTIRVVLQFTLLALLVTLMLYYLSGEYQKTIVAPKKFLSSTNKGLRQLNVRLIKIKTPLTDSVIELIREFLLFIATMCLTSLHKVYPSMQNNKNSKLEVFLISCQLQCQPRIGVTDVKLVLNARVFSTDVREGWELYRSDFWVQEGVRRRQAMMEFTQRLLPLEKLLTPSAPLDREKLLKKDRRERRDKRKKSVGGTVTPTRLSEQNLRKLNSNDSGSLSPNLLSPSSSPPLSPQGSPRLSGQLLDSSDIPSQIISK